VVFETAYHTNENLLISAPTGAGKTNVALLTVIREIKQHIVQDTIKKNEFKVNKFIITSVILPFPTTIATTV